MIDRNIHGQYDKTMPPNFSSSSRREFILRSAGAALAIGLLPKENFASSSDAANDFEFIAVNDIHFTDVKLCPPWFEKTFAQMKQSAPHAELMIVSGDLTSDGREEQFGGLKEVFSTLKIPVYVTPGNHDFIPDAAGARRDVYEKFFPGTVNYAVEHRGWQLFCLNSIESGAYQNTKIPADTLQWMDDNLKKFDPKKPTLVSTHFPLGMAMNHYRPTNTDAFLSRLRDFNVRHLFNGHWHGYSEMLCCNETPVTTNRCCSRVRENHDGSPLKGWFVCQARQGNIARRFVRLQ